MREPATLKTTRSPLLVPGKLRRILSRVVPMAPVFVAAVLAAESKGADPPMRSARRLEFTVTPAATGRQLVRLSLPFAPGLLMEGQGLDVSDGHQNVEAAVRVLTWHPAIEPGRRSARRALVTFPYTFADRRAVTLHAGAAMPGATPPGERPPVEVRVNGTIVTVAYRDGPTLTARLLAPDRTTAAAPVTDLVESNAFYDWRRVRLADARWPRVIEVRVDALGGVILVAHVQRNLPGNAYAPDLGWQIETDASPGRFKTGSGVAAIPKIPLHHDFATGADSDFLFDQDRYRIDHPAAPFNQRGHVEVGPSGDRGFIYRYLRCTASEKVPMQQAGWRRADVVIAPTALAPPTATLESPHDVHVDWRLWDALYETGPPLDLAAYPDLAALLRYHHDAIVRSAAHGDDWGNVTSYDDNSSAGSPFGMNRLNHCPAIFEEAWRSGDRRLRDVAVAWCDDFYDLSVWWGADRTGGTRYNNILAMNRTPLDNDRHFMWRSNGSVDFCTKGYCSFLLAYEQTGDPRMREALDAQVSYASQYVHADRGEARNIGDADDFMRLYRYTGEQRYLVQALRLFRELRTKLSAGDLFSQGGQSIEPNPPFIDDDETGYHHPFAKPYIIGYALLGLPRLAQHEANEPKLYDVVRAVADFLAESQDPAGGWRYPHPRSTSLLLGQAVEHAWQISEADRLLGPQEKHLDAIERVLRQRLHGWKQAGRIASGVTAWELVTGKVKTPAQLRRLYRHPEDRDRTRDDSEGRMTFGSCPPEGLVYFPGTLAFYLKHRPASLLLAAPRNDEPLGKLLSNVRAGPK